MNGTALQPGEEVGVLPCLNAGDCRPGTQRGARVEVRGSLARPLRALPARGCDARRPFRRRLSEYHPRPGEVRQRPGEYHLGPPERGVRTGGTVTRTGQARMSIVPGTPMRKVIPPRLVGPYLNGQRSIIAGFVYRAREVAFRDPAECFMALRLGYEGSEFTAEMTEVCFLCWQAREMDTYAPTSGPGEPGGGWQELAPSARAAAASSSRVIPEFYTDPMPIPVGASIRRLTARGDDLIARYDGLAWRRPTREA